MTTVPGWASSSRACGARSRHLCGPKPVTAGPRPRPRRPARRRRSAAGTSLRVMRTSPAGETSTRWRCQPLSVGCAAVVSASAAVGRQRSPGTARRANVPAGRDVRRARRVRRRCSRQVSKTPLAARGSRGRAQRRRDRPPRPPIARSSGQALSKHSHHSCAGVESTVMPPPTPSDRRSAGDLERCGSRR